MKTVLYCSFLLILVAASCKIKCQDPGLIVEFDGYDSSALQHIVIRQYSRNSNYSQLVRTNYSGITIPRVAGVYNYNDGDTIPYNGWGVGEGNDFEFELPLVGKTYRLSEISFDQEKGETTFMNKFSNCSNTVTYNLDGTTLTGKGVSQRADKPGSVYIELTR